MRLADGRLARFGKKLRFATLRDFIEDAIHQEMGITSPAFPTELTHGGRPLPDDVDPAPDPEIDSATLDLLTDYVRLLAPPERQSPDIAAVADSITEGRLLFGRIGCADCHTPAMQTGASDIAALDRKTIMLYSDLLLHDMGDELASICAPHASPSEWRTAPLLGLRHRAALLHDGRTAAYRDAIEDHGGEAANARARFLRLDPGDQARLLRFLGSL